MRDLSLPQIVEDVPSLPLDLPLVLMKPKEECATAEVYKVADTPDHVICLTWCNMYYAHVMLALMHAFEHWPNICAHTCLYTDVHFVCQNVCAHRLHTDIHLCVHVMIS
jgi:hypothetical protein